jgi:hypothetical protein
LKQSQLKGAAQASSFQSAPYTHVGLIVTKEVTHALLDSLTSFYMVMKGASNCTRSVAQEEEGGAATTVHAPYNMQADYAEAQIQPTGRQLVTELVTEASRRDVRNYSAQVSDEYLLSWTSQQTALIDSLSTVAAVHRPADEAARILRETCGLSSELVAALLQSTACDAKLNKDFHRQWLPCIVPVALGVVDTKNTSRRRALLQQQGPAAPSVVVEHSQCTFMSSTAVKYASSGLSSTDNLGLDARGRGTGSSSGSGSGADSSGATWIILGGIASGLLVSGLMVIAIYMYCIASPSSSLSSSSSAASPAPVARGGGSNGSYKSA